MTVDEDGPTLEGRIDTANETLLGLRRDYQRQERRRNLAVVVSSAVAVAALIVAVVAVRGQQVANAQRNQRSVASCEQSVLDRKDVIAAVIGVVTAESDDFVDALASRSTDPATPQRVAAFKARHHKLIRDKVVEGFKLRDCTPEGIADYFAGRGGYIAVPTTTSTQPPQ